MASKLEGMSRAERILIASDFDGTIAPIVDVPSNARARPETVAQLARLASMAGVSVAVVSGRALSEMDALCSGFPASWKVGDHGRSAKDPQGRVVPEWSACASSPAIEPLARAASAIVRAHPGASMERKTHGVCLHTRNVEADRKPRALAEVDRWIGLAVAAGFEILRGREVVEVQVPGEGKHAAIQRLAGLTDSGFVVFAGDDTTDIEAVTALSASESGMGVWVRSAERAMPESVLDAVVDGPAGWASLLERIADLLEVRE